MGHLIAFPTPSRTPSPRRQMALEMLYALTYALGLFLAAPVLVLIVLAGVYDGELVVSAWALGLLAVVLPLTGAARRRL